ncbi:MAG: hypothetical protein E6R09_09440 [Rhodocyclaceae bacterium]|nr:MAG: hypothetical protein E6R09_09440 [Rhodocyclaceae bacterium]
MKTKSNRFKKAVIDDGIPCHVDQNLEQHLFELFIAAMRSVSCTLVREAKFNTDDFASAKERNCLGFSLSMKRVFPNSRDSWSGTFERGEQTLNVLGHMEDCDD